MIKKILLGLTIVAFAFAGGAFSGSASAQGIKRTPLQKIDFPEGYTTVTAIAEVPAGGASAATAIPASRPATFSKASLNSSSMASRPLKLKAGESYQIPAGAIHDAKAGDKPFKVLGIYIVDKTKPLATPAS